MNFHTFCAANSGKGFISFFNTILDERNKTIYYIKGGPGCGKSTLMNRIAEKATDAELIFCSGDPKSLDGLILSKENAVIIDATAPHNHEPLYPGVGGNIIDLGIGWLPEKLDKKKIIALSEKKTAQYKKCYHLLSAAKSIHEGTFFPLVKHQNIKKIASLGDKILKQNALWEHRSKELFIQKRFLSIISPDGRITQNRTFEILGKNLIILEDRWLQSSTLLEYLDHQLSIRKISHINGYHPLFGEPVLQHLIIPEAELSIVTKDSFFPLELAEENISRSIHLPTFIEKDYLYDHKNKLTFLKRIERELLDLAVEYLKNARATHLEIEAEYAKGYSFEAAESLKAKLMNNLFG